VKVRDALLSLLVRSPAHGYQLKVDFERLTGARPVNVGQIYTTLDRLQRDGLVERERPDEDGRVVHRITEEGRKAAVEWLLDPSGVPTTGRSEVAGKVLLALHVPDVDTQTVIDAHRLAFLAAVQSIRQRARTETLGLEARLLVEAEVAVAEAELRWLDLCEAELHAIVRRS
jgi:DNA-binding PadR family transcriptional regulator